MVVFQEVKGAEGVRKGVAQDGKDARNIIARLDWVTNPATLSVNFLLNYKIANLLGAKLITTESGLSSRSLNF